MKPRNHHPGWESSRGRESRNRRKGIILVLTCLLAPILFGFLAYAVDTGLTAMTQTRMQNAADAAALAATQEIRAAIAAASQVQGQATIDANSIAVAEARTMAERVAAANGVYIDPQRDVVFGRRAFDEATNSWPIEWNQEPYNVVRVDVHRDNTDSEAPDARLPLNFGTFLGKPTIALTSGASAFVESRDLVLVLDYSGSMSYDSELSSIGNLARDDIIQNQKEIFQALEVNAGNLTAQPQYLTVQGQPASGMIPHIATTFKGTSIYTVSTRDLSNVVLEYSNGNRQKFDNLHVGKSGTFAGTGANSGKRITRCWVKSGSNASGEGVGYGERFEDSYHNIKVAFDLYNTPYPYPSGNWDAFIRHARCEDNLYDVRSAGLQYTYGGPTFVDYLLAKNKSFAQTPDLWKTPEYPFHAMKNGVSMLLDFLDTLGYGDEVGIISYGTSARWETTLDFDGYSIDLGNDPVNSDYESLDLIQRHRQAAHYTNMTAMGDGIKQACQLLEQYSRYGSRPTVLVITDGNTNQMPSGWRLPTGWNWNELTDYDGDGVANYTTNDVKKQYAFYEALQGMDSGYTFHTMTVGADADRDLMEAIAFAGKGTWIDVPGGSTVEAMQEQMLAAFGEIAGRVPPPTLVYGE
ncbi:MAG: vWA domain-containing protein [Thermoguttaceae bacterium]